MRIRCGQDDLVLVDRDAALRSRVGIGAVGVLPDQIAGLGIQRLQDVPGVVQVHDAVVNDGRGLIGAGVVHRPAPHQLQTLRVIDVDLIQRAEVMGGLVAANHQPVAGRRILQHRVRHRNVVLHFSGTRDAFRRSRGDYASALRVGIGSRFTFAAFCGSVTRGLTVGDQADGGGVIRGQRLVSTGRAIPIENVRRDGEICLRSQAVRRGRRHGALNEAVQLARIARAPARHERRAGQCRCVAAARQCRQMARRAIFLVRSLASCDLRRGERACRTSLLCRQVAREENYGRAHNAGQGDSQSLIDVHG